MNWFVYDIVPIDFGWGSVKTVKKTLSDIALEDEFGDTDGLNSTGVQAFIARWDSAKAAAAEKGWDGEFRHPPCVFWLPAENDFVSGFVFKQDNNGNTFVISPVPLPWLDQLS